MRKKPACCYALSSVIFAFSFAQTATAGESTEPFDTNLWTWSGGVDSVSSLEDGWKLIGGDSGQFLESTLSESSGDNWLVLRGSWLKQGAAENGMIIRWNGCEVILHPSDGGWVPSVGNALFREEFASPFETPYEIQLRQDEAGRVDFFWNGTLLLEQADFGFTSEGLLLVTVAPGWDLGLKRLHWELPGKVEVDPSQNGKVASDGVVLRPGESRNLKGVNVPPPDGPPPPHPYLAMDEKGHLLFASGQPAAMGVGKLHTGGALRGNGKPKAVKTTKK